jgi:hypothetical protein
MMITANSLNKIASGKLTSSSLRGIVASGIMHGYGTYDEHNIEKRFEEGNASYLYFTVQEVMVSSICLAAM